MLERGRTKSYCTTSGWLCLICSPLIALGAGCNGGLVGLGSSLGSDGGGGNAPTSAGTVQVTSAQQSPATISFVLTDAESNLATVGILFFPPGGVAGGIRGVPGAGHRSSPAHDPVLSPLGDHSSSRSG